MKLKLSKLWCIVLMLVLIACSSGNERIIKGKWALAGRMIGGGPSSFWFKGGTVIAPWESRNYAIQSKGKYVFTDDTHFKVMMNSGYYEGNTYFYDIVKLDENELILRNNYQDIKLKRAKEE